MNTETLAAFIRDLLGAVPGEQLPGGPGTAPGSGSFPGLPLLWDAAALARREEPRGPLRDRLERRRLRLLAVQGELGKLDFNKRRPGAPFADFVFEQTDFKAYEDIPGDRFCAFFEEGLEDFGDSFFVKNFGRSREETRNLIRRSYQPKEGRFCLRQDSPAAGNPLTRFPLLSLMRGLHTSLELAPLFTPEEFLKEALDFVNFSGGGNPVFADLVRNLKPLFKALVRRLDHTVFTQRDGTLTELFITPRGDLAGIFHPSGKAWTFTLIRAEIINITINITINNEQWGAEEGLG